MKNVKHVNGQGRHTIATDKRLSMKARGLWFILWAYINDHDGIFSRERFKADVIGEGVTALAHAFDELEFFHYFEETGRGLGFRIYELRDRSN